MAKYLEKKQLGNTELEVSTLGFGTVKVGRNVSVKNKTPDGFELPDDKIVLDLLDICRETGINLIDTAPAYGLAEERIGKLLKGSRKDFILSTKAGEQFNGAESIYNFSLPALTESVHASLKKLKTDYLDIVLLHLPRNDLDVLQNTPAILSLLKLKEMGDIRYFGASTHTVEGGEYALKYCDALMLPYNIEYKDHLTVIEKAKEQKKGIFIKKGLLSGHIKNLEESINEVVNTDGVSSLIVGTINPDHLRENIACV